MHATLPACVPAVNFDTHIEQMFSILYSGGLLVISRPGHHTDPDYMMQLIAQYGVTYLFTVRDVPCMSAARDCKSE